MVWGQTSACKGSLGSRYQSMFDLTYPTQAMIYYREQKLLRTWQTSVCPADSEYQGSSPKSKPLSHCTFQLSFSLLISKNAIKSLGPGKFLLLLDLLYLPTRFYIYHPTFKVTNWVKFISKLVSPLPFKIYPTYFKGFSRDFLITWIALKFQWTGLQVAHTWLLLALMQLCVSGITIVGVRIV